MEARTQAMSRNSKRSLPERRYPTAIPLDVFASSRSLNAGQCTLGAAKWPERALRAAPSYRRHSNDRRCVEEEMR